MPVTLADQARVVAEPRGEGRGDEVSVRRRDKGTVRPARRLAGPKSVPWHFLATFYFAPRLVWDRGRIDGAS